jgi:glycosyltransferase involved in cell wall biosynthesis
VTKQSGKVIIGWIGTPGTLFNLFSIFEPLERIFSRLNNIELRIVGSGHRKDLLPCFERVKYSTLPFYNQKEMIEEVLKMDIGLFPLFDIDNSNARGILKATIYMSGEVAVIGSAIGQTPDLISDGTNGLLARTPKEWEEKLEKLITDSEFRKRLSKNGLETVRSEFTTEQNFKRLLSVFQEV